MKSAVSFLADFIWNRFLKLDIDPGKAEQEAEKDGLTFCYRGLVWKPLFEIDREPFQVYWEKV